MRTSEKYISMKWRVVLTIVPITAIITLISLAAIYISDRNNIVSQIEGRLSAESEGAALTVEVWANESQRVLEIMSEMISRGEFDTNERLVKYLSENRGLIRDGDGCYVVYTDGTTVSRDGVENFPNYLEEEWYKFGLTCDEPAFDKCSLYEGDGLSEYSVTLEKNIKDSDGNVIGVIATDITFANIKAMVDEQRSTDGTEFMLVDSKSNMVIGSTDVEMTGEFLGQSEKPLLKDMGGDFGKKPLEKRYKDDNGKKIVIEKQIENTPWKMVVYIDEDIALSSLKSVTMIAIIGTIAIIGIVSIAILHLMSRQMKFLVRAQQNIGYITEGDFSKEVDTNFKGVRNEITDITEKLAIFVYKMKNMIGDITKTADTLEKNAKEFNNMSSNINESAVAQKDALTNLTKNVEGINGAIQVVASDAQKLAGIADETKSASVDVKSKMDIMAEDSRRMEKELSNVSDKMNQAVRSMDDLVIQVEEVGKVAQEINSITDVIKSIAAQTNLLSLNASIEAARAGEAGKGFAVVAEEIKELAATCETNAVNIEELVNNIAQLMTKTTDNTVTSADGIKSSGEVVNGLVDIYGRMIGDILDASQKLDSMLENTNKLDEIAVDMASITQEQAASSQEVLDTTVEVDNMVEDMKISCAEMNREAEEILSVSTKVFDYMGKFKIESNEI